MAEISTENCRLGACEVCGANAAKYVCPKCEVKTCSLKCVNIHKKELDCDGIRDRTKYVPLTKFTNLDLLSDYRMLEEVGRSVETFKRDKSKRCTRINQELPKHLFLLKKGLQERQTAIRFLPSNFSRHKENTTYINFKTRIVYWRIQWIFYHSDNFQLADEKCEETLKLSSIVHKYFDPKQYDCDSLKFYQSTGLNGVSFYLKAENVTGNKYYHLDSDLSLKESLKNKTIIEYPRIFVVFKDHSDMFEEIATDDEETSQLNPTRYISAIVKNEEENSSVKKNNLLFVTEYSDDETMLSDNE